MPNKHKPSTKGDTDASTSVKLGSLKKRLDRLAELQERSTHFLIKQAVERYLDAEEEAQALKQETLRRWEQEALLNDTIAHGDVMDWLDSWDEKGVKSPRWK
ncbi:MAG: CopG family ribbon-helix-helix protein [Gammaproteobacteria bacterium]